MSDLQQEMEAFFAEYTKRWNNQEDYSSLIEMWDQDDDAPFYRGMEKPGFFDTWERLKLYWDPEAKKRACYRALVRIREHSPQTDHAGCGGRLLRCRVGHEGDQRSGDQRNGSLYSGL